MTHPTPPRPRPAPRPWGPLLLALALAACGPEGTPMPTAPGAGPAASVAPTDLDADGYAAPADCVDEGYVWQQQDYGPCDGQWTTWYSPLDGSDLKDFSLVADGDSLHLVHIRRTGDVNWGTGDSETTFGHAVTTDFVQWELRPNLELTGQPGDWNGQNIWAPHIVREGGQWHMFLAGVQYEGDRAYNRQRIGHATSTDLYSWDMVPSTCDGTTGEGCVLDCDAPWTRWSEGTAWTGDCRDPWVVRGDDRWYMVVSSSWNGSGGGWALSLAESFDLVDWQMVLPILPSIGDRAESPALLRRGDTWHLFWTSASGIVHSTAANPVGPWSTPQYVHWGYANELLPLPDGSWYFPVVGGYSLKVERIVWGAGQQFSLSNVVQGQCRLDAALVNPGQPDDPHNGVDDDCDGVVDGSVDPPPGPGDAGPPPRHKLPFTMEGARWP